MTEASRFLSSWGQLAFWGTVLFAAVLLRVSIVAVEPLLLLGLFLLFVCLVDKPGSTWAAAGLVVGLVYSSAILIALIKWGPFPALILWLALGAAFAVFFGLVGAAVRRGPIGAEPFVLGSAWVAVLFVVDRLLYAPVYLTTPLVWTASTHRQLLGTVGLPVAEGLVVMALAGVAFAVRKKHLRSLGAALPLLVFVMLPERDIQAPTKAWLHMIQPNFDWQDYAARAWSLESRRALRRDIDALTKEATQRTPGTIVWPENGSGVADGQLLRRRTVLQDILSGGGSDLVTVGLWFVPGGHQVAARHLTAKYAGAHTAKAKLVPLAEADVLEGRPRVLETKAGRLGFSICFDVLFGSHVRALVDQGAELLVVSSDNASFGSSTLPRLHAAYAFARAAEVQRSLLFGANRGPSYAFDVRENRIHRLSRYGERTIASVALTRSSSPPPAHLVITLLFCAPLVLLRRRLVVSSRPRFATAALAALLIGVLLEVGLTAIIRGVTVSAVASEATTRFGGARGVYVLPSHFLQSDPMSCGRAALAYALTLLGDDTFEEDLADVPVAGQGTTLLALAEAVRRRGFAADLVRADTATELSLDAGSVAMVHLERGHYVVVSHGQEGLVVFDPARGQVSDYDERWRSEQSGAMLRIRITP